MNAKPSLAIVVMGVTGSGKSTLGRALSAVLEIPFLEGDDFHSAANIAKMKSGSPLTDEDRWPWLTRIGNSLASLLESGGAVVSCSALKRSYRDLIRSRLPTRVAFIHLSLDAGTLQERMAKRDHFMPVALLESQLATLEPPGQDECALVVDAHLSTETQLGVAQQWLAESALPENR